MNTEPEELEKRVVRLERRVEMLRAALIGLLILGSIAVGGLYWLVDHHHSIVMHHHERQNWFDSITVKRLDNLEWPKRPVTGIRLVDPMD